MYIRKGLMHSEALDGSIPRKVTARDIWVSS